MSFLFHDSDKNVGVGLRATTAFEGSGGEEARIVTAVCAFTTESVTIEGRELECQNWLQSLL